MSGEPRIQEPTASRRATVWLALLLVGYILLAACYSVSIPPWEAPDAVWHYHFVAHLADGGGLPTSADEGLDAPWRQQGSQPPLYYLAMAPIVAAVDRSDGAQAIRFNPHASVGVAGPEGNVNRMVHRAGAAWPWEGSVLAAHLVGLAGIAFGIVTVLATWALARSVLPGRPAVAVAAAGLVAFNPQFVFLSAAISNDVAMAAVGALVVWRLVELLRRGPSLRQSALAGLCLGAAVLTKLSGLWLVPVAIAVASWAAWRTVACSDGPDSPADCRWRDRVREIAWPLTRSVSVLATTAAAIGGWWYARNWLLFGDPTGLPLMLNVMTPRLAPPTAGELARQLIGVWKSYWAVFGWYNVPAPDWVYVLVSVLAVAGVVGGITWLIAGRRGLPRVRPARPFELRGLAASGLVVAVLLVAIVVWAQVRYPQGRLAYPAASALALLLATGWTAALPDRWGYRVAGALSGLLAVLSAWLLCAVALPAYGRETPLKEPDSGWASASHLSRQSCWRPENIAFGEQIALRGRKVEVGGQCSELRVHAGDRLAVALYWEPLANVSRDYSVFLHCVDDTGAIVAQRDSYPGSGNSPTGSWRAAPTGRSSTEATWFADRHSVRIPPTAKTPCVCQLYVGLYDATTGERLTTAEGSDRHPLERVSVAPAVSEEGVPNPLGVRFGDHVELVGYELTSRDVAPGEVLPLTLFWRTHKQLSADLKVSVQLRRGAAEKWGQRDEEPADGTRPTSSWRPGELVVDEQPVRIYEEAPAGEYRLLVKLYEEERGGSLPVDVHDWELDLGRVVVRAGGGG